MLLNCGVGEDFESILDCKNIQPVYPKGDMYWVFIGRTDVEAETPILWPPDGKSWPIWKTLMLGKIEGRRRRGRQRMRWLDGITDSMKLSFGRLWVGDGQGGLACCSPWSCKELDMTELNRTVVTSFLMSSCLKNFIPRITQFLCDELLHLQIFKFYLEFPRWLHVKEFACNAGDTSSTPGLEKYPAEGNGNLP